jgi:hypothetical protein
MDVRDWKIWLMISANDSEVAIVFGEINQWLFRIDFAIEKISAKIDQGSSKFDKMLAIEKKERVKADDTLTETLDTQIESFEDYKDLAEDTFQEMYDELHTLVYVQTIQGIISEDNIYAAFSEMFGSVGDVSGDVKRLFRITKATTTSLKTHKVAYTTTTKDHVTRIKDLEVCTKDMDEAYNEFEEKVNKNFKIAEQAMVQMNHFSAIIDSRLTVEELMGATCMPQMQRDLHEMIMILQEETQLQIMQEQDDRIEGDDDLEKKITEEAIPEAVDILHLEVEELKKGQGDA